MWGGWYLGAVRDGVADGGADSGEVLRSAGSCFCKIGTSEGCIASAVVLMCFAKQSLHQDDVESGARHCSFVCSFKGVDGRACGEVERAALSHGGRSGVIGTGQGVVVVAKKGIHVWLVGTRGEVRVSIKQQDGLYVSCSRYRIAHRNHCEWRNDGNATRQCGIVIKLGNPQTQ